VHERVWLAFQSHLYAICCRAQAQLPADALLPLLAARAPALVGDET